MTVAIEGEVRAHTDQAVLIDTGDGRKPVWIPRSVIDDGDDLVKGDTGEFEVAEWFAEQEGLE